MAGVGGGGPVTIEREANMQNVAQSSAIGACSCFLLPIKCMMLWPLAEGKSAWREPLISETMPNTHPPVIRALNLHLLACSNRVEY